jgi:hypothetical protein
MRGVLPLLPTTPSWCDSQFKKKKHWDNFTINFYVSVYCPELQRTLHEFNWDKWLPEVRNLEGALRQEFAQLRGIRHWREGTAKSSFIYLMLDPRISDNLPARVDCLNVSPHTWSTFLSSVFYIGKGKLSRPLAHLHQAHAVYDKTVTKRDNKVNHIVDIWKEGLGVVYLHVFHNVMPVEAYTYEAAMIDAIGLKNLKNARCGTYYGAASAWTPSDRRKLGTYLLYRAMCIFVHEGERQLRPADIRR